MTQNLHLKCFYRYIHYVFIILKGSRLQWPNDKTMNNKRTSSIHKIREINLQTLYIDRDYDVLKEIGSGDYGKVILSVHRETGSEVSEYD